MPPQRVIEAVQEGFPRQVDAFFRGVPPAALLTDEPHLQQLAQDLCHQLGRDLELRGHGLRRAATGNRQRHVNCSIVPAGIIPYLPLLGERLLFKAPRQVAFFAAAALEKRPVMGLELRRSRPRQRNEEEEILLLRATQAPEAGDAEGMFRRELGLPRQNLRQKRTVATRRFGQAALVAVVAAIADDLIFQVPPIIFVAVDGFQQS